MEKLKQLFQSRKFWGALIPFIVAIIIHFVGEGIDPVLLTALLSAIAGTYIIGTAVEDGQVVKSKMDWNYNNTIQRLQNMLANQEELLKQYQTPSVTNKSDKVRDPKTGAIKNTNIKNG